MKPVKPGVEVRPHLVGHLLGRADLDERSAVLGHPLQEGARLGVVGGDDDRRADRPLDRRRIAPDLRAVALEDLGLVAKRIETEREPVGHVGVLCRDPQGPLLAATAHEDRRSAWAGSGAAR